MQRVLAADEDDPLELRYLRERRQNGARFPRDAGRRCNERVPLRQAGGDVPRERGDASATFRVATEFVDGR